jgi:GntR family transcriptional regulator/MocR family aminotransferase
MAERESRTPESDATIALLSVTLDRQGGQSLVRQLYAHLRELILARRIAPGARLPSTRKLSRELDVSRTVTLEAFGQLAAEGFLETRLGSGHYVAQLRFPEMTPAPSLPAAADAPEKSIWSATGRPFDPAWQAVDLFPSQVWGRMLGRGWRRHQASALERHWLGLPAQRSALVEHLHALRGVVLSPEQVMITSGMADALTLVGRAVSHGGEVAGWVENPGLGTSREILGRNGIRIVPVPVDADGLCVDDGERLAPDAKLALVTPTRQFPLGMPLSLPRRLALLEWARRSGAIVLDDDYEGEIRFAGRPLQSLASLDPGARVLTLGSFSKLTFAGLRLGYVAGPADLIARLAECRRASYSLVATSPQAALAEFVATGAFARHLRALRSSLTRRRLALVETLKREAGDLVEVLPQEVGMHVTVRLAHKVAARISDVALSERAAGEGLVLLPLSGQYVTGSGEGGFLLGYAGWTEAEFGDALRRLITLLRSARHN